jgi:hypothetical protein
MKMPIEQSKTTHQLSTSPDHSLLFNVGADQRVNQSASIIQATKHSMQLPVTNYVVMLHHHDVGTFAPAFPNLDEAEEFSNAMRLITNDVAVSEPVPVAARQAINFSTTIKSNC